MKTAMLVAFWLTSVLLHPYATEAQPTTEPSACEYQETRDPVPINPMTNKPYTPNERKKEPFSGASITKEQIKQCLQTETPIKNHHIVFEDYRDAWQELAKETADYAIPLLITGGVLHANTPYNADKHVTQDNNANTYITHVEKGGIRLVEFRDPTVKDASKLTEEERKTFGIEKTGELIAIIRSRIEWEGIFIDSAVSAVIVESEGMYSIGNTPTIIFRQIVNLRGSDFSRTANLKRSIFVEIPDFSRSNFINDTDFRRSIFVKDTHFSESTFSNVAYFGRSIFNGDTYFRESTFINDANFSESTFSGDTRFSESSFRKATNFSGSIFSKLASFSRSTFGTSNFSGSTFSGGTSFGETNFSEEADFSRSNFRKLANFSWTTFRKNASFRRSDFSGSANFSESTFSKSASFSEIQFRDSADFRHMIITETLTFNDNTYHKRLDLRGMSAKTFQWDSTNSPSNVQGVVDIREAYIGSAIVKEVRFQDLVDFSRATFGRYRVKLTDENVKVKIHPSPIVLFKNNTFENETDFLHVKFNSPTVFINNRFRSTLDLTGATFEAQNSQDENSHLCFSFNRINRLVFEPKHLGNPPGFCPYQQLMSLFVQPLQTSKVRQIGAPECALNAQTASNPDNTTQDEEPLDDIYRTLGKSFREANDREGINEAWYLQTLAERDDSSVEGQLAWIFLDIPSRYTIDVWRTVCISVVIMFLFCFPYALEFWRIDRANKRNQRVPRLAIQTTGYARRPRAFRFRIFESVLATNSKSARRIIPLWDAAMLSIRTFLKLGLGTTYPKSIIMCTLFWLEWALGVWMLILFISAVKNNLPFILPFLGAVN